MTMKNKKVWYAPNKFEAYGKEEINAVKQCLEDGWLAGFGPRSIEFAEKVAKYFGKKLGLFVFFKKFKTASLCSFICSIII